MSGAPGEAGEEEPGEAGEGGHRILLPDRGNGRLGFVGNRQMDFFFNFLCKSRGFVKSHQNRFVFKHD